MTPSSTNKQATSTSEQRQKVKGDKLVNNTSKLIEVDERIKKESKKLKEVEDDSTFYEEQRQLSRMNNKQGSKYYHKAKKQARIKQTIGKA